MYAPSRALTRTHTHTRGTQAKHLLTALTDFGRASATRKQTKMTAGGVEATPSARYNTRLQRQIYLYQQLQTKAQQHRTTATATATKGA